MLNRRDLNAIRNSTHCRIDQSRRDVSTAPSPPATPAIQPDDPPSSRRIARAHTADAIATLVAICRNGASESARVAAANALLDRGYGRPSQAIEHEVRQTTVARVPHVCATVEEWAAQHRPKAETVQ